MKNTNPIASDLADEIEAELKSLGLWASHLASSVSIESAFGADQLSFEEWIQAVLLPRLRNIDIGGCLPNSSNLAIAGIRNFDGLPNVDRLLDLLAKVDALAVSGSRKEV
jgi:uncharacterized protein YqcC (DUF446 family)